MAWLLFMNVLMLSRLWYLRQERPAPYWATFLSGSAPIAALGLLQIDWRVMLLGAMTLGITAVLPSAERRSQHPSGPRALAFVLLSLASVLLLDIDRELARWATGSLETLAASSTLLRTSDAADWLAVSAVIFGFLVLTNEANLWIRYGFRRLDLEPKLVSRSTSGSEAARDDRHRGGGERHCAFQATRSS